MSASVNQLRYDVQSVFESLRQTVISLATRGEKLQHLDSQAQTLQNYSHELDIKAEMVTQEILVGKRQSKHVRNLFICVLSAVAFITLTTFYLTRGEKL